MTETHTRDIDRWLKWVAILGPLCGFVFGIPAGAVATYQAMVKQDERLARIEGWKAKQDDFNERTVVAIARLKAIVKDTFP